MSKKAPGYVFEGLKAMGGILKKDIKIFIGCIIVGITSLFGKLFFITFPIYAFGEYNVINDFNKKNEINLNLIFEDVKTSSKYWTIVRFIIKSRVGTLAGLTLTALLSFGLINVGYGLDDYFGNGNNVNAILFQVISGLLIIVLIICRNIFIEPIVYFLWEKDDIELTEVMKQRQVFKSKLCGLKLFLVQIMYFMIFMVCGVLAGTLIYLVYLYKFYFLWKIITIIIVSIVLLLVYGIVSFSYKVSSVRLFEDFMTNYRSGDLKKQVIDILELDIRFSEENLRDVYKKILDENEEVILEYETSVTESEIKEKEIEKQKLDELIREENKNLTLGIEELDVVGNELEETETIVEKEELIEDVPVEEETNDNRMLHDLLNKLPLKGNTDNDEVTVEKDENLVTDTIEIDVVENKLDEIETVRETNETDIDEDKDDVADEEVKTEKNFLHKLLDSLPSEDNTEHNESDEEVEIEAKDDSKIKKSKEQG